MNKEITISTTLELRQIEKEISLFNAARKKKVKVHFEKLNEEENKQLEMKVNKLYAACGCSQGRTVGIITLLVFVGLLITGVISYYSIGFSKVILLYFLLPGSKWSLSSVSSTIV